jgi:hypothetical protein
MAIQEFMLTTNFGMTDLAMVAFAPCPSLDRQNRAPSEIMID